MNQSSFVTVRTRFGFDGGEGDAAAFIQRRVANAALLTLMLFGGFAVLRAVSHFVEGDYAQELVHPGYLFHLAGLVPASALWLLCRKGKRNPRFVAVAEIGLLAATAGCAIAMGAFLPALMRPDMIVALVLTLMLTARAAYVPSSALRTLFLGLLLAGPYLWMVWTSTGSWSPNLMAESVAALAQGDARVVQSVLTAFGAGWFTAGVAVSVATSRVIYGLREQVREVKALGQYQLDEKLGEGGMGIVYRAHHALLQRPTAVKLLPPDRIGEKSLERFEREVQQTARLSHPNTITIFDYGHTPDGIFYYAMELLDGVTLDRVVDSTGRLPAARVIHILRQAAGSLAEAHAIGLVHRDVKPENIMLCEQGGIPDTVKVLDFGLVKEVARGGDAKLTGTNVVMGTPQYMAPEAIADPDTVDARADLYALAAAGYYLLTARDLFEASSIIEMCSHHLRTPPTPPSQIVDGVPRDLEAVLLRCLAKKPDERPRDGRELASLLADCRDAGRWSEQDARSWWEQYGTDLARPGGISATAPTMLA